MEDKHLNMVWAKWSFLLVERVERPSSLQAAEAE